MEKTWFSCLIVENDTKEPETFLQQFWTEAEHMGEAIEKCLSVAGKTGYEKPVILECDPCDMFYLDPVEIPNLNKDVFWNPSRNYFPYEPNFEFPQGIVPSGRNKFDELDEIKNGFTTITNENGLIIILANLSAENLFPTYKNLIELNPSYRVFWYVLHDEENHDAKEQFLVNEALNTPELIIQYLEANWKNSLSHGFVTVTSYLEEGDTNISITNHKQIKISSFSSQLTESLKNIFTECGLAFLENFVGLDKEMHHWHFRYPEACQFPILKFFLRIPGFPLGSQKIKIQNNAITTLNYAAGGG